MLYQAKQQRTLEVASVMRDADNPSGRRMLENHMASSRATLHKSEPFEGSSCVLSRNLRHPPVHTYGSIATETVAAI